MIKDGSGDSPLGRSMVDPHRVRSCTLNLTLRGLITYVCLWVINLQNFNHLTEKEIQNNMLPISLKLVTMQVQMVSY